MPVPNMHRDVLLARLLHMAETLIASQSRGLRCKGPRCFTRLRPFDVDGLVLQLGQRLGGGDLAAVA